MNLTSNHKTSNYDRDILPPVSYHIYQDIDKEKLGE